MTRAGVVSGRALALCGLALMLPLGAGCGGEMKPDELLVSVQTLESTAASGELLARDVARDRTKATYARVYARELSEEADHESEKLNDATPREAIAAEKDLAVDLAGRISEALGQIQESPGDESAGRMAAKQLSELEDRTKRLGEQL